MHFYTKLSFGRGLISPHNRELSSVDIIDEAHNGSSWINILGVLDDVNIINHTLRQFRKRQEVDITCISIQALLEDTADVIIAESEHTAVSVVDDIDLIGTQELLGNSKRAESVTGDTATSL